MSDYYMLLALLLAIAIVALSIARANRSPTNPISLVDLLLGADGRLSKAACVMFGAFLLTSWVIVLQTSRGTLSDLTFGAYLGAWVAPTVTALIVNRRDGNAAAPPSE